LSSWTIREASRGPQARPVRVGRLNGAAQAFCLAGALLQVLLDFLAMAMVILQRAIHVRKLQGVELANDLFRRHPAAMASKQRVQGDARGADRNGPCFVDTERHRIGVHSDSHGSPSWQSHLPKLPEKAGKCALSHR